MNWHPSKPSLIMLSLFVVGFAEAEMIALRPLQPSLLPLPRFQTNDIKSLANKVLDYRKSYLTLRSELSSLTNLKGEDRIDALRKRKEFPNDPLKVTREAFEKARRELADAIPAEVDNEKQDIRNARKTLNEANEVEVDQAQDQDLTSLAYKNLAKSVSEAIGVLIEKPSSENDSEAVRFILHRAHESTQSLGNFSELAKALKEVAPELTSEIENARKTILEWKSSILAHANAAKAALEKDSTEIQEQLKALAPEVPGHEERAAKLQKAVMQARLRREGALLAVPLLSTPDTPFDSDKEMKVAGQALRSSADALRPVLELGDDLVAGNRDDWEQAAIPIYYFNSVPRLMAALNLDAERFENSYFHSIETNRKALLDAEKSRDLQRAEANRLVSELANVLTKLQTVKLQQKINAGLLERVQGDGTRLDRQIATLADGAQKETLRSRRQILADQEKELAGKVASDSEESKALEAAQQSLTEAAKKAGADLEDARKTLNRMQLEAAALADSEVRAFRENQNRAPFWVSRARQSSGDPAKRCDIFGYDDSLVVFVRGRASDINLVRSIIHSFDRPTPQARLTLHTLQFNGSNANRMRIATEAVERATAELRDNMTLIQDTLRNAISKEVNRQARVAETAIKLPGDVTLSERVYRGFYYPREIREALGLRIRLPEVRGDEKHSPDYYSNIASALDDVRSTRSILISAADKFRGIQQLSDDRSARTRLIGELEGMLTAAEFLFTRVELHNEDATILLKSKAPKEVETLQATAHELRGVLRKDTRDGDLLAALDKVLCGGSADCATKHHLQPAANDSPIRDHLRILGRLEEVLGKDLESHSGANERLVKLAAADAQSIEFLTTYTLPDPSRGTTLGELLFVFSLGGQASRTRILRDFSSSLLVDIRSTKADLNRHQFENFLEDCVNYFDKGKNTREKPGLVGLAALAVAAARQSGNFSENLTDVDSDGLYPYFPRTVFGGFAPRDNPGPTNEPMTANQLEILSAIKARVRTAVFEELSARLETADGINDEVATLANFLRNKPFDLKVGEASVDSFLAMGDNASISKQDSIQSLKRKLSWTSLSSLSYDSAGRIAAADDMIKRFVTVLEDDLDHYLVAPTLRLMRESVNSNGLEFSSLQTTSLLASNRGTARYDASAVATLGQDPEAGRKALLVGQQLGDVSSALGGFTKKTSGIAPVAAPLIHSYTSPNATSDSLWKIGGLGLLGAALLLPDGNPQPAALYSLSSGGEFKVTPILDPSGQALRFDLDYSLTTRVQEPVNSGGIELPRVERQSLNIPVQVSNLDFRRVASFEANSRIGVEPQYFGGIPFFKQLPLLKDIPLIGYFARSKGKSSMRQQTYIFVQSNIYPTVSDIVGLLVETPLRSGRQRAPREEKTGN